MTPVKVNEGTFEPTGKAIICHCVALPDSVHDTEAVVPVIFDTATEVGLKHVIGGVQRIVASQPVLVPVALDVNEKDKQPVGDVEVKLGGKLAPVYVPTTGDVAKWTNHPFTPTIHDGKIFARGSNDDKGPTMAAYFALRFLKDLGHTPNKRIRIIFCIYFDITGLN